MIEHLARSEKPNLHELPSALAQSGTPVRSTRSGSPRPPHLRKIILRLLLAVIAIVIFAAGIILWQLSRGGVSNDQVKAQIETQLATLLGKDREASIGDTRFAIGGNGLLSVDARDVRILGKNKVNLGVARSVAVKVKALPLLGGQVEAQSLAVSGASLAVAPTDAPVSRSGSYLTPVWPRAIDIGPWFRTVGDTLATAITLLDDAGLEDIKITDANLVGYDQFHLGSRTALLKNLEVTRTAGDAGELEFALTMQSDFGQWKASGNWTANGRGGKTLQLQAADIRLAEMLTVQSGQRITAADKSVSINLIAPFRENGEPEQAILRISIGKSGQNRASSITRVVDTNSETPLPQNAVLNFRVLPQENQITLERSTIQFDRTDVTVVGGLRYPTSKDRDQTALPAFLINVESFAAFGLVGKTSVPRGSLEIAGHLDPVLQAVEATRMSLKTPGGSIDGSASLMLDKSEPHLVLDLAIPEMPVDEFKQFWPEFIATNTREWAQDGLHGGMIRNAWLKADFPPGLIDNDAAYREANLAARVPVFGSSVRTAGDLPRIDAANGVVELKGNLTNINLSSGKVSLGRYGSLKVGKSALNIGSFALDVMPAELQMSLSGPASALTKLGTLQPLSFSKQLDLDPNSISGSIDGTVNATLLFAEDVSVDERSWKADVRLSNGSYSNKISGRAVDNIDVSITAIPGSAKIEGTADLDGVRSKLSMTERFDGKSAGDRTVTLVLTDADRKKMGFDTGGIVTGTTPVTISGNSESGQTVEADLRGAKLDFPWIGWTKGAGIPAKARFVIKETSRGTELSNLSLSGSGFSASGGLVLDGEGFKSLSLQNVRLNQTDDFDVDASRSSGGYSVKVRARTYDGRALIRTLLSEEIPDVTNRTTVRVSGRVGKLIGFNGESLANVDLDFEQSGKKVERSVIKAIAPGNAPTIFNLGPVEGGMETRISTSNAGSVLRFLDLYSKIRGGTIQATLVRDKSQVFRGLVVAQNFTLLGEPRLAQLLQKPRLSEDIRNADQVVQVIDKIRSDQAKVDRLQANIEKGKGYLDIQRGRVSGGDASAAFEGRVYDANNRMNIKGTYLPGRALNQLVSKIPLFGLAFGKGKVSGLLGITFKLSGRYGDPKLQVNPLSIIAPGVLREIFKF